MVSQFKFRRGQIISFCRVG